MTVGKVIKCIPNGPLVVSGLTSIQNTQGEATAMSGACALCRCGKSNTKPYCDGTHEKVGFNSECESDGAFNYKRVFKGKEITIFYNQTICSKSTLCSEYLPKVFQPGSKPDMKPDEANLNEIIAAIQRCPSGALSYRINEVDRTDFMSEEAVQYVENGPYAVKGGIELEGADFSHETSTEHYTLCRCGKSKNKPFCDGNHIDHPFE